MNQQEKQLITNMALLTKISQEELKKMLKKMSFKEADAIITEYIMEDAEKRPKSLLKKYYTYCINMNENYKKMIEDIRKFSIKYLIDIDISKASYIVRNSSKVNNIMKDFVGENTTYYSLNDLLSQNNLTATFIEAYCDIHDINIIDDTDTLEMSSDGMVTYFKSIPKEVLTREEEKEFYSQYKAGDEKAKVSFIEHNLRLAVSIAARFTGHGVDKDDLVQAGNEGLLRAFEKFDPDKGYKFSTYATWWIRQSVTREIDHSGRSIRLPVYILEKIRVYKRIHVEYSREYGRKPTDEELIEKMNISKEQLDNLRVYMDNIVSLETPVGEEDHGEQSTLGDFVVQDSLPLPEDYTINNDIISRVDEELDNSSRLTKREIEVLKYRFGFYGEPLTLEEVGKIYNVTRERIRQVEERAKSKLSHNGELRDLAREMGINAPENIKRKIKK